MARDPLCEGFAASCSREERRWIEKQNKAVRLKKKKEEVTRLRTLVGGCWEGFRDSMNHTED